MELRDLIVTPLLIMLVYGVAYVIRPWVTDEINRVYFLPALTVRIIGALAVGFIYQFYYDGGDTFNYHTHGSRHLWEAFMDSPGKALKLFFSNGEDVRGVYNYASKIIFLKDPQSYAIVRIAFVFDLFTFSTYSATAVLFAVLSFVGMWMFFLTFYRQYPYLHRRLALASFFIPSVFFWGSGLLKDTVTLACIGAATYLAHQLFIEKKFSLLRILILLLVMYALYVIKVYIVLTFVPAIIIWVFFSNLSNISSVAIKIMLAPLTISLAIFLSYFAMLKAGEDNPKYSLAMIGKTAQVTAYDIRYWTGREAGSGYTLGELDGTFGSMVKLAPQAINVSLFRPYLWEVKNPLMLLSACEAFALLCMGVFLIVKRHRYIFKALLEPNILYCLIFSLAFAFAVGVSTFNFGTLVRYKIPLLPFYAVAMILLIYRSHNVSATGVGQE